MTDECSKGGSHVWHPDGSDCLECGVVRLFHTTETVAATAIVANGFHGVDVDLADRQLIGNPAVGIDADAWVVLDVPVDEIRRLDDLIPGGQPITERERDPRESFHTFSSDELDQIRPFILDSIFNLNKPDSLTEYHLSQP